MNHIDYGCQSELEFQTCGCPKICGEKVGNCSRCEAGCHCPGNLWRFEAFGQLECVTKEECPARIAEKIRKEEGKFLKKRYDLEENTMSLQIYT